MLNRAEVVSLLSGPGPGRGAQAEAMALAALAWETGAVVVAKGAQDVIVVAVAERFRTVSIAILDRHHFSVVCPAHAAAFTLLP